MKREMRRIVVVEDDASMRQAIQRILRAGGHLPVVFASAETALDTGSVQDADCLVLDIHLPGISGFEMYRQMVHSGDEPPAIFITARDSQAVREEAESLGAKSYHLKPFTGRTLLDAVNEALR